MSRRNWYILAAAAAVVLLLLAYGCLGGRNAPPPATTTAPPAAGATGFLTAYTLSAWPDLVVGLAIMAMNADAAREVWEAAREECHTAEAY